MARSLGRAAALAAGLAAVVAAGGTSAGAATPGVVSPYLEVGGANTGNLAAAINDGLRQVTAAFVIGKGCTPIWDTGHPVASDSAASSLISSAQKSGVAVTVSFGGQGGEDLARTCANVGRLTAAYRAVVRKFKVTKADFDIEGAAMTSAVAHRFAAIKALESSDPALAVSLTVPVGPSGLVSSGIKLLKVAKRSGVRVDLVNVMAMDYGSSTEMGSAAISAAQGTLAQLRKIWPADSYANIGITPMIGQNDTSSEVFTLADVSTVTSFAASNGVGRLGFWSLNRDQACATNGPPASGSCSGVSQQPLDYTRAFLGG